MKDMIEKLRGKKVHITYLSSSYQNGGIAAANYTVVDSVDGFLQLKNDSAQIMFYKLDQIKQITVFNEEQ